MDPPPQSQARLNAVERTELELSSHSLASDGFEKLCSELSSSTTLRTLKLRNSTLRRQQFLLLAHSLAQISSFRALHLECMRLSEGIDAIQALAFIPQLQILNLTMNSLGPEIGLILFYLTQLTSLNLGNNQLDAETVQIFAALPRLREIDLQSNRLGSEGARALQPATQLTSLNIARNGVGDQGAWAVASLTQLRSLCIQENGIHDLGAQVLTTLTALTVVNITHNRIGTVGARAIGTLTGLTSLAIEGNAIGNEGIGAIFATCSNLRRLQCGENGISILPDSISKLQLLELFQCGRNELTSLPLSIRHLSGLQHLLLDQNPLVGPLRFVIAQRDPVKTATSVRQYLTDLALGEGTFRSVKLMLVGHGHAGKSTLRDALIRASTEQDMRDILRPRARTRGIETSPWMCDGVSFNVWDFGGQMEYATGNQHFVSEECAVYILVLNPDDPSKTLIEEQLRFWLGLLEAKFDPVRLRHPAGLATILPVVSRGDQLDTDTQRQIRKRIRAVIEEDFNHLPIVKPLECHVLDYLQAPNAVRQLRARLIELGREQLRFSERLLPSRYEHILALCGAWAKEILDRDLAPVLHYQECLQRLSKSFESFEPQVTEFALELFCTSGHLLRFDELVFLEPQWLFTVVGKFVRQPGVQYENPEDALLTLKDIQLLRREEHIQCEAIALIGYLKQLRMCYALPVAASVEAKWLFPDRLPLSSIDFFSSHPYFQSQAVTRGARICLHRHRWLPSGLFHMFQVELMTTFPGTAENHRQDVSFFRWKDTWLACRMYHRALAEFPHIDIVARGVVLLDVLEMLRKACWLFGNTISRKFPGWTADWWALCSSCASSSHRWPVRTECAILVSKTQSLDAFNCRTSIEQPSVLIALKQVGNLFEQRHPKASAPTQEDLQFDPLETNVVGNSIWTNTYGKVIELLKQHISGIKHALSAVAPADKRAEWDPTADGARRLFDYVEAHAQDPQFMVAFRQALEQERITLILKNDVA